MENWNIRSNDGIGGKGYWIEEDIKEIKNSMSHVDSDFVLKYKNICFKPPKVEESEFEFNAGISVVCFPYS